MEKSDEASKDSIGFCFAASRHHGSYSSRNSILRRRSIERTGRLIQQQELHFAPPLYRADGLAFPTAEGYVFLVNVPVPGFQLADKPAFRMPAMTEQHPLPHVVAQDGQEQLSKPKYYPNLTFYYIEYQ